MQRTRTVKVGIICAANVISVMWLFGQVTGQIFKHYNAQNVDVNNGLAYLGQVLVAASVGAILMLGAALFLAQRARKQGDSESARLMWRLLEVQVVILALSGLSALLFKV